MPAVLTELASGQTFELGDFAIVGRTEGATVRLADTSISRQHASIRRENGGFWLVDLGSANGSYVNNVALTGPRILRDGDRVQFGTAVLTFREATSSQTEETYGQDHKTTISLAAPAPVRDVPATLLVADLCGFTAMSQRITPGEVADLLREWYADCTAILGRHGASIDKFIGDCVFAYWLSTDADTRASAILAARALRDAEEHPQSPARVALAANHALALDCRIGLHVGPVAIGAMGKGLNTALGDAVNTAFRIEAMTRDLRRPALASAAFVEGVSNAAEEFETCGEHLLKGIEQPVTVYAVRGLG